MRRGFRVRLRTAAIERGMMASGWPSLDERALVGILGKALVGQWQTDGWSRHAIELDLDAGSGQDAIEQVKAAIATFGLTVAEAVVTDLIAAAVQRAAAGALVFGLVGATSRNVWVVGLSSIGGAVAGVAAEDAIAKWNAMRAPQRRFNEPYS
jgi:hypothetical protein